MALPLNPPTTGSAIPQAQPASNQFLTSLRQASVSAPTPSIQPNQTETVQSLINAKSGKANTTGEGPRISNIGEQQANAQAAAGVQQQLQQQQVGAQKQAGQIQQQDQDQAAKTRTLSEETSKAMDDYLNQTQSTLDQYVQGTRQLDMNKDKAKLEQMGIVMRMANDNYVSNLQREGARARLNNDAAFNDALNRSVFADEEDLMQNDLQFRSMLNADDRSFNEGLANINLDFAVQMANSNNRAAANQQMWTGIGSLAGAGVKGAATYAQMPDSATPSDSLTHEQAENVDVNPYGSQLNPGAGSTDMSDFGSVG